MRLFPCVVELFIVFSLVVAGVLVPGLTGQVRGGGTTNYIPIWTSNTNLGNSTMYQDFYGRVGIGTTTPLDTLTVNGTFSAYDVSAANQIVGKSVYANLVIANAAFQIGTNSVLSTSGTQNLFLGQQAGQSNTTGKFNVFSGFSAGSNNTTGSRNAFFGNQAGSFNTTGSQDTFFGNQAGSFNTTGSDNTFVGDGAGLYSQGADNTFLGARAGLGLNGEGGNNNVFVGFVAGYNNNTGSQNVFLGNGAGLANRTGKNNTLVGWASGSSNVTGSDNVYLGYTSGQHASGSNNIYLGEISSTLSEGNTIRIGTQGTGNGQQTAAYIAGIYGSTVGGNGVAVYVDSNGQLGTTVSSRRFKEQIQDMGDSSSALMKLRPVTFLYKPEYDKGQRTLQYGLIAEEVAEVYPNLIAYDPDGKPYTVKYQYLTTMLLNEMQKQYHRAEAEAVVITKQEDKIEAQQSQITTQQQQLDHLQQRLSRLESLIAKK